MPPAPLWEKRLRRLYLRSTGASGVLTLNSRGRMNGSAPRHMPYGSFRELYMKSRICFYFAAVVALVLFVGSLSSHATERRDPLIVPDAQQTQSAKAAHSSHAKASQTKPAARSMQKQTTPSASTTKNSGQGVNPLYEGKDQMLSETSSGSGKNGRSGAGK